MQHRALQQRPKGCGRAPKCSAQRAPCRAGTRHVRTAVACHHSVDDSAASTSGSGSHNDATACTHSPTAATLSKRALVAGLLASSVGLLSAAAPQPAAADPGIAVDFIEPPKRDYPDLTITDKVGTGRLGGSPPSPGTQAQVRASTTWVDGNVLVIPQNTVTDCICCTGCGAGHRLARRRRRHPAQVYLDVALAETALRPADERFLGDKTVIPQDVVPMGRIVIGERWRRWRCMAARRHHAIRRFARHELQRKEEAAWCISRSPDSAETIHRAPLKT